VFYTLILPFNKDFLQSLIFQEGIYCCSDSERQ